MCQKQLIPYTLPTKSSIYVIVFAGQVSKNQALRMFLKTANIFSTWIYMYNNIWEYLKPAMLESACLIWNISKFRASLLWDIPICSCFLGGNPFTGNCQYTVSTKTFNLDWNYISICRTVIQAYPMEKGCTMMCPTQQVHRRRRTDRHHVLLNQLLSIIPLMWRPRRIDSLVSLLMYVPFDSPSCYDL